MINTGIATSVSESSTPITRGRGQIKGLKWKGMDLSASVAFDFVNTSGDFIKTNGLKLLAGRDINIATYSTDTASCMINETALKLMGFKDPIGQIIK